MKAFENLPLRRKRAQRRDQILYLLPTPFDQAIYSAPVHTVYLNLIEKKTGPILE